MKLSLYYNVRNDDVEDGNIFPKFMESRELAEFDQRYEQGDEFWTHSLTFESDSQIRCLSFDGVTGMPIDDISNIMTKEAYFVKRWFGGWVRQGSDRERSEFIVKFFPNGLPKFTVKTRRATEDHLFNDVFVGDQHVVCFYCKTEKSGDVFEKLLNGVNDA